MKSTLFAAIALLAWTVRASSLDQGISGQVFIVTNAGSSVKLGGIEIRLYDSDKIEQVLKRWKESADRAATKADELAAQAKKIESDASADLDRATNEYGQGQRDLAYAETKARISGEAAALSINAQTLLNRIYSAESAFAQLPSEPLSKVKTDADGNFSFPTAPSAVSFAIVAVAKRKIGDDLECFFWAVRAPLSGKINLSNDNSVSSGSDESLVRAADAPSTNPDAGDGAEVVTLDSLREQIRAYLDRGSSRPKIVTITEPIEVELPSSSRPVTFGRGKQLPLVIRNGDIVIVRYLEDDVSVPVSSTDLAKK
jgi:hypothetical protein